MADQTRIHAGNAGRDGEASSLPKLNRVVAASLSGCIHCGMCSDACHYSVSIPEDKTLVPAYKADRFRKWYKSRYDWMGRIFPSFVGAQPLTKELGRRNVRQTIRRLYHVPALHIQLPHGC